MLSRIPVTSLKAALVGWMCVSAACVRDPLATYTETDEEAVTLTVLTDFLRRQPENQWPVIFVSDQYVTFGIDSAFLSRLPAIGAAYVIARRSEAEQSPDIVKGGGLFLEPLLPQSAGAVVLQALNFSANADYGGEYVYRLKWLVFRWSIIRVTAVWLI